MGGTGAGHKAPAPDKVWTNLNPPWMTLGKAFDSGGLTFPSVEWMPLVSSPSVAGTGAETSLLGCPSNGEVGIYSTSRRAEVLANSSASWLS